MPAMVAELAVTSSGIDVRLDVAAALDDLTIDGDAQRLVQMLSTLLRFMSSRVGGAEIVMSAARVEEGVRHDVQATGAPLSPVARAGRFSSAGDEPFAQGLRWGSVISRHDPQDQC